MNDMFRRFAVAVAQGLGSAWAFMVACATIIGWAMTGPYYGFSDRWQLVANTATNVVTILMVFVIQNSQNRDAIAVNIKLDELLRAVEGARTGLINVEALSDEDLLRLEKELVRIGKREGVKPVSTGGAESRQ